MLSNHLTLWEASGGLVLVLGGLRAVSQTILLVISPGASKLEHGSEWVPSDNLWKEAGKERESKTSKHSVMRLEKTRKHNRATKWGLEGRIGFHQVKAEAAVSRNAAGLGRTEDFGENFSGCWSWVDKLVYGRPWTICQEIWPLLCRWLNTTEQFETEL